MEWGNRSRSAHATGKVKMVYAGHTDNVYDVALSADEKSLASSTADGIVLVHDVESGELRHQLSHPGQVASVHWIGKTDEFVSIGSDSFLKVWNASTGKLVREVKAPSSLFGVDIDPSGETIATGGRGDIHFWDAKTLEPIETKNAIPNPFQGHRSLIFGLQFVGDNQLFTSGWDKQTFAWDRSSGAMVQLYDPNSTQRESVLAITDSASPSKAIVARGGRSLSLVSLSDLRAESTWSVPDVLVQTMLRHDNQLYLAGNDGKLFRQNLDADDPGATTEPFADLPSKAIAMRVSQQGKAVLVATEDGDLLHLDATDGEILATVALQEASAAATWSTDPDYLFVMSPDGKLTRYEVRFGVDGEYTVEKSMALVLPPQSHAGLSAVTPSRILVNLSGSNGVLMDVKTMGFVGQIPNPESNRTAVAAFDGGSTILVGTESGKLSIYRIPIRPRAPVLQTQLDLKDIRYLSFSKDGKKILAGTIQCDFVTLSAEDLVPEDKPQRMPPFGMASSKRTPDRRLIAVGSWDGQVLISDPKRQEIVSQLPTDDVQKTGKANAVALTPDGERAVVGTLDRMVRMYQTDPPKLLWTSEAYSDTINDLDISSDGKYVVASTGDYRRLKQPGLAVLIDAESGKTVQVWQDSKEKVTGIRFSPDSSKVVACGNDGFRTYDVPTRSLIHTAPLFGCNWVRFIDQRRCVVTQYPGKISIWDSIDHREVGKMTGHTQPAGVEKPAMLWGMDVSDDGKRLVTGDLHGQIFVWPLE